jgi:hypothetical protein
MRLGRSSHIRAGTGLAPPAVRKLQPSPCVTAYAGRRAAACRAARDPDLPVDARDVRLHAFARSGRGALRSRRSSIPCATSASTSRSREVRSSRRCAGAESRSRQAELRPARGRRRLGESAASSRPASRSARSRACARRPCAARAEDVGGIVERLESPWRPSPAGDAAAREERGAAHGVGACLVRELLELLRPQPRR